MDTSELDKDLADLEHFGIGAMGKGIATNNEQRYPPAPTIAQCVTERKNQFFTGQEMWAVFGNGRKFHACEHAVYDLPPGQYTIDHSDNVGIYFQKTDVLLDTLMNLPDSKSSDVIKEIDRFWTLEPKFREYGFMWKRGVLLWGPPGSGKTSTLQLISKSIVDRGGLAIYVTNPHVACKGLQTLRSVEKQRPIVVMIEDIDAVLAEYGESELLALMDGELQIDNIVFVATTNYPELLDKRFVNRPSRFDIIRKIGMPSDDARRSYLSVKNSRLVENKTELEEWVAKSKNFSIAHLKELIIAVEILGQPIDFACARLHKMSENLSSSNSDAAAFGFANKG